MSRIKNENLGYLPAVEQYFLALKDSGLALSSADYHLITQWEEQGVPVATLCRAITRAYERHCQERVKTFRRASLSALQPWIEEEIRSMIR